MSKQKHIGEWLKTIFIKGCNSFKMKANVTLLLVIKLRCKSDWPSLFFQVWHVSEYDTIEMDPKDFNAQFFFEDTYVVRWKYKVSLTGKRL